MVQDLIAPVLLLLVSYLVRAATRYLKIDIDEKAFNAIVASIVAFLLANVFEAPARSLLGG